VKAKLLAILVTLLTANAASADALQPRCGDAAEITKYAATGLSKENTVFSLKKKGETYYEVFLSKADPSRTSHEGKLFGPWRLAARQGDSIDYCLVAGGDWVEPLVSVHQAPGSGKKYGMPGSGDQRCSDGNDVLGSMDVRIWANKELGDSFVVFLTSDVGNKDFFFLISNDQNWTLLDSDKADSSTCYFARGDDAATHQDFPTHF